MPTPTTGKLKALNAKKVAHQLQIASIADAKEILYT
jgi:hypothetical protein